MKSWATTLGALPNEAMCVAAAKIDPAAFAALYDHYFAAVYNYVRYRLADPVSADDVTAQIFEKVQPCQHSRRSIFRSAPWGLSDQGQASHWARSRQPQGPVMMRWPRHRPYRCRFLHRGIRFC
jgi:hypothetical protein